MPTGPQTKIRAEDQIRGHRLELGGAVGGGQPGTLVLNETTPGLKDAQVICFGSALVHGNLTVLGDSTVLNVGTVDVEDVNITVNKGGTDLTAHGAGITVFRATSPFPNLVWSSVKNAWVAGLAGSEKEITLEGNAFNGPDQLAKLDGASKLPIYSTKTFVHDQIVAAASWVISHGMSKRPSVGVVTSAGDEVEGFVSYVDDNNIVVSFNAPFSGRAYLN